MIKKTLSMNFLQYVDIFDLPGTHLDLPNLEIFEISFNRKGKK